MQLFRPYLIIAALIFAGPFAPAADQPQWGERFTRNMVSDEKGLPDTFDPATGRNIKWVVPLGTQTYSTPIIAAGRVFIGTNNAQPRDPRLRGDRGILLCLDEKDGSLLWQLATHKREDKLQDWPDTGICSPPTVEGDRLYLVSNRGEVLCLDLHGQANGNDGPYTDEARYVASRGESPLALTRTDADILWLYDMTSELGIWQHDAAHCSILLVGDHLYVCTSNGVDGTHRRINAPHAPSLIVINKNTGRLVATDDLGIGQNIVHSTWSSPSIGTVNGRQLVFFGAGNGICYAFEALPPDLAGPPVKLKQVWSFDCDPTAPKEHVHQYQGNRKVSPSNITGMPVFHDGRIFVEAGGDVWHGKPLAWLKCIDASKVSDITQTGQVWSYTLSSHCMSTPAIYNGMVFIADAGRLVHCLDLQTGRPFWTHKTSGDIWGSTLVADGKVYVGTRRGDFWILRASPDKQVIASIEFDSPIHATPTAANGTLYVATMTHLYAIQQRPNP